MAKVKKKKEPLRELPINVQDGIDTLKGGMDQMYAALAAAMDYIPLKDDTFMTRHLVESAIDSYEVAKKNAAERFEEDEYKVGLKTCKIKR